MSQREYQFVELTTAQQLQASAMFMNASPEDGYWYLVTGDMKILSRNKVRQIIAA